MISLPITRRPFYRKELLKRAWDQTMDEALYLAFAERPMDPKDGGPLFWRNYFELQAEETAALGCPECKRQAEIDGLISPFVAIV